MVEKGISSVQVTVRVICTSSMASSRVTISSSPGKMAVSGVMPFSSHSSAVVRLFLVAIRLMLSPATTV